MNTIRTKLFIICVVMFLPQMSFALPADYAGVQEVVQTSVNLSGRQIQTIEDVDRKYVGRLMSGGKYTEAAKYLDKAINSLNNDKYAAEIAELRMIAALAKYKSGDTKGAKSEYNELQKFYGKNIGSFRVFIAEANAAYDLSAVQTSDEDGMQNDKEALSSQAPEFTEADRKKISKLIKKKKYDELVKVLDEYLSKYSKDDDIELYTAMTEIRAAAKHKSGDEEGAMKDYEELKSIYGSVFGSYEIFIQAADKILK